jgi:hypothetical protein
MKSRRPSRSGEFTQAGDPNDLIGRYNHVPVLGSNTKLGASPQVFFL